ncbi:hypothetical protein F7725_018365 [Dissostichus mawsoni]|uniref:Transmembrane protein 238 n=1 Tax=Dissostichus mawsoni TaxID=36200 RepID=A0A7J5XU56_DISMA|nr:hypothetical protein F7725_018365 [Dissostichus mawsoni]
MYYKNTEVSKPVGDRQEQVILLQGLHPAKCLLIQGSVAAPGIVQKLLLGWVELAQLCHLLWGHKLAIQKLHLTPIPVLTVTVLALTLLLALCGNIKRSSWQRRKSLSSSKSSILFCIQEFFSREICSWVRRLVITMYKLFTWDGPADGGDSEEDRQDCLGNTRRSGNVKNGRIPSAHGPAGCDIPAAGVFAPLEIQGRDFGDLLVYTGALLVLFSLAGWVMWYSGNIEGLTSRKELGSSVGGAMDRLARSLSRRIRIPRTRSSPT